jgi:hypothetical protein
MCSYIVRKAALTGSAKGPNGWMRIDTANVYFDHPYHAPLDHALGIDFINAADGGRERRRRIERAIGARAGRSNPGGAAERGSRARRATGRGGMIAPRQAANAAVNSQACVTGCASSQSGSVS